MPSVAEPKKRAPGAGRPKSPAKAEPIASFKGRPAFKLWFEELCGFLRLPASTTIEHAVILLAKESGFKKPPPPR